MRKIGKMRNWIIPLLLLIVCVFCLAACDRGGGETAKGKAILIVEGGVISGGQTRASFDKGASVTVTADEREDFAFKGWSDGSRVVSTEKTYTFVINSDLKLSAVFARLFNVSVTGGIISGADGSYGRFAEGDCVTLSAEIPDGKLFKCWSVGGASVSTENPYTFTVDSDISVTAVFSDIKYYTLSVFGGGVIGAGTDTEARFEQGAEVEVSVAVPEGKVFKGWRSGDQIVSIQNPYRFSLSEDTALAAVVEDKPIEVKPIIYNVTIVNGTSDGSTFVQIVEGESISVVAANKADTIFKGWFIDGELVSQNKSYTFSVEKDVTVIAVFAERVTITISAVSDTVSQTRVTGEKGELLSVTAPIAADGWEFAGWFSDGNRFLSRESAVNVKAEYNASFTALYRKLPASPDDLSLTLLGAKAFTDLNYAEIREDGRNFVFRYGTSRFFIKADDAPQGTVFEGLYRFSDNNPAPQKISSNEEYNPSINIAEGNCVIFARFVKNITATVQGGVFTDSGSTTKDGIFAYDEITVEADEIAGKVFSHWLVNGERPNQSTKTQTFTVLGDTQIEAVFIDLYKVTVKGGLIKNTADTSVTVEDGTSVTVVADADSEQSRFVGWFVAGKQVTGPDAREYKFKVSANVTVSAVFEKYYTVSVTGGTVNGRESGTFKSGEKVIIKAAVPNGQRFARWEINGQTLSASRTPQEITVNENMLITAYFDYIYTVKTSGGCTVNGMQELVVVRGEKVIVRAEERDGMTISAWYINGRRIAVYDDVYTYELIVNENVEITAEYIEIFNVTVINAEGSGVYRKGEVVTLIAAASEGSNGFKHWLDDRGNTYTNQSYTFTVERDITLTAVFETLYLVKINGGKFASGSYEGKTEGYFPSGASVSVRGELQAGYRFDKWTDDKGGEYVTLDFTAVVSGATTFTLKTVKLYSVTVRNSITGADEVKSYDAGSRVSVTTEYDAENYVFWRWTTAQGTVGSEMPYVISSLNSDVTLTAEFKRLYTVRVINADGLGINESFEKVAEGETRTVTASVPNSKMAFTGWKSGGNTVSDSSSYTFGVSGDMQIEATFSMMYTQKAIKGYTSSKLNCENYPDYYRGGDASFIMAGLSQGENFVPQGIEYFSDGKDIEYIFVSGYISPSNGFSSNSVLFVYDFKQQFGDGMSYRNGKLIKEIILQNADGSAFTGHAGGIAVTGNNVFIANSSKLYRISMETILNAKQTAFVKFESAISVPVKASYASFADGVLWVGEFEYGDKYKVDPTHIADGYRAWTVGYEIDVTGNAGEFDPITGFKTSALSGGQAIPDFVLRHGQKIQGMTFAGNKIVLSESYGRTNVSHIYIYDNSVYGYNPTTGVRSVKASDGTVNIGGREVNYWNLDNPTTVNAAPMTEDVSVVRKLESAGRYSYSILVATESASWKYNGAETKVSLHPMDTVWQFKIEQ